MRFANPKLPRSAALDLRRFPMEGIEPYVPVPSPLYVYLKRNKKFIGVKGPLDFFDEAELEKLKPMQTFYVPKFVDRVLPFQSTAQSVKALLNWQPKKAIASGKSEYPEVPLPVAPYELSDAILQALAPVWAAGMLLEPFFAAVLMTEVCGALPEGAAQEVREKHNDQYDRAVLCGSFAAFLALHLGYCEQDLIRSIRDRSFEAIGKGKLPPNHLGEECEITHIVQKLIPNEDFRRVEGGRLSDFQERVGQKLVHRFKRLEESFVNPRSEPATIYGEGGFRSGL